MKTAAPAPQQSSGADGPAWREEWVSLAEVRRIEALQVRARLDPAAVKRYRAMTEAGSEPPPIKVARTPDRALCLIDGWHRIEAGALVTDPLGVGGETVRALVADMTENAARWEAAAANLGHGVRLKSGEMRGVFKAYIAAGRHKLARGQRQSYRGISAALAIGHTTIRTWMIKDFPQIARHMGGHDHGNPAAGPPPGRVETLASAHREQTLRAIEGARAGLAAMTAEDRGQLAEVLRQVLQEVEALGTEAQPF